MFASITSNQDGVGGSIKRSNKFNYDECDTIKDDNNVGNDECDSDEGRPSLTTNERLILLGSDLDSKSEGGRNRSSNTIFDRVRAEEVERINTESNGVNSVAKLQ